MQLTFKESIVTYLASKDIDALKKLLQEADEVSILEVIMELPTTEAVIVYRLLSKDRHCLFSKL